MSNDFITDALSREVVKKVANHIDIDAMAKKLAPQLEKSLEKSILDYWNDGDMMYDLISESMNDKVYAAMRKRMSNIFLAAFEEKK
jgi:membrane protease subunit (stomatin/prohibitin family)